MPIVQYVHPTTQTTVTRTIPVPKKVQELYKGWYREARKWCPQIPPLNEPNVGQYGDGRIYRVQSEPEVSLDWIKFVLENDLGEKAHVVINRRAKM